MCLVCVLRHWQLQPPPAWGSARVPCGDAPGRTISLDDLRFHTQHTGENVCICVAAAVLPRAGRRFITIFYVQKEQEGESKGHVHRKRCLCSRRVALSLVSSVYCVCSPRREPAGHFLAVRLRPMICCRRTYFFYIWQAKSRIFGGGALLRSSFSLYEVLSSFFAARSAPVQQCHKFLSEVHRTDLFFFFF